MKVRERTDPRLENLFGLEPDPAGGVRPVVPLARKGPPAWLFIVLAGSAALLLFVALEARRNVVPVPAERRSESVEIQSAPDLHVPPSAPVPVFVPTVVQPAPVAVAPAQVVPHRVTARPGSSPAMSNAPAPFSNGAPPPPPAPQRVAGGPPLLIEPVAPPAPEGGNNARQLAPPSGGFDGVRSGGRMRASTLANQSNTVAQGTVIPAVLETAFNSTLAGFARAIVSRNLRSFDGTRTLIPRGSRLVGEYSAQVGRGQKRATINWTRLIRPDGVTISLNSPAVDPLGRGGVEAKVNSHLFERFTGALFQSVFDIGGAIASRPLNRGVVVAMPGGTAGAPVASANNIVPTLTVPAGKSISVFVAHDLEFSSEGTTQ